MLEMRRGPWKVIIRRHGHPKGHLDLPFDESILTSRSMQVKQMTTYVMTSLSSARQSEVKAWEEEITACEHTLLLQSSQIPLKGPIGQTCTECDLQENLWLCMTCGNIGCGRQQFGGLGGNGHGLKHYEAHKHPVAVKLGTITAEGNAGMICSALT